jgi:peptide/nickel transport system ATP-binding protein
MIYQDPISSLNPRRKVRDIVAEGLAIWGRQDGHAEIVAGVMHDVGLDVDAIGDRRPHEFSGGQCQRICIARSLVLAPTVLICDEPVSALDVSVQAQILNLLEQMKERYDLTLLFIAHDLAVVKNVSDRVAVMYLGKLCELGPSDEVYAQPAHPYTRALMAAVPVPDPDVPLGDEVLHGDLPSPISPPSGCRFRTRCALAIDRCAVEEPALRETSPGHVVACHLATTAA